MSVIQPFQALRFYTHLSDQQRFRQDMHGDFTDGCVIVKNGEFVPFAIVADSDTINSIKINKLCVEEAPPEPVSVEFCDYYNSESELDNYTYTPTKLTLSIESNNLSVDVLDDEGTPSATFTRVINGENTETGELYRLSFDVISFDYDMLIFMFSMGSGTSILIDHTGTYTWDIYRTASPGSSINYISFMIHSYDADAYNLTIDNMCLTKL